MANDMLVKEVANISTDVLSELGKLVSAYKDYTETLAAVQKQIEYTKEYKEKQTQTARENLVRKTAGTCDTIRIQLESLENTVNSLDQTLNVADPELMPCVGLLANSPEALPLELIGSVAVPGGRDPPGHPGRGLRACKTGRALLPRPFRRGQLLYRTAGPRPGGRPGRPAPTHPIGPGDRHPHGRYQRRPLHYQRGRQDAKHPALHSDR